MPAEFFDAPQVEESAKDLIGHYHQHLASARIKYLFREGAWSKAGAATRVNARDKKLHGYDFLIVINKEFYEQMAPDARRALIDHELSHCGISESGDWKIWKHDVEDFAAVIARHGVWNEGSQKYLSAGMKRIQKENEPNLFNQQAEEPETIGQQDEKAANFKNDDMFDISEKPDNPGQAEAAGPIAPPGLTVIQGHQVAPTSRRMGRRGAAAAIDPA
ncbi:MAG: hypothetical protein K6U74_01120 [Firmicutes bacterium]|nr:hypothetical protein [Bacillota bacterium]